MPGIGGYCPGDQGKRKQEAGARDIGSSKVLLGIVLCRHGLTKDERGQTGKFIAIRR
jgi:hypothetical protein